LATEFRITPLPAEFPFLVHKVFEKLTIERVGAWDIRGRDITNSFRRFFGKAISLFIAVDTDVSFDPTEPNRDSFPPEIV
jgi:hypothetical protein